MIQPSAEPPPSRPRHAAPALRWVLLLPLTWLTGCAGVGLRAEPVEPAVLAYEVPEPNAVAYQFGDTARFAIEAGPMGTMMVTGTQEGMAEVIFREAGNGVDAEVRFPELAAAFSVPQQGAQRADASDIQGPVGLHVGPGGRVTVTDTPTIGRDLAAIVGVESLVRPLFVSLPARSVGPGDSWVDTVRTAESTGETTSTGTSVITTTLVRDTLVDGRTLLLLRTVAENDLEVAGLSGGVEIQQLLAGTTRGTVLWDPERHLLVAREEQGELSGTLEMPEMGMAGLPVRGTIRRSVRLAQ